MGSEPYLSFRRLAARLEAELSIFSPQFLPPHTKAHQHMPLHARRQSVKKNTNWYHFNCAKVKHSVLETLATFFA